MLQTWRWFGPDDPVSLEHAAQAGASGIVTALHHRNQGEVWSADEIAERRSAIERAGLVWSVVESIGVGEEIKTRSGGFRQKIDNYKQSIRNAARAGVKTFCYNFMAITDWTRTNLDWRLPNGGAALRFDAVDYRGLRSVHARARGGGGRPCAGQDRRRQGALRGDDGGAKGNARAGADRLAAGPRLRLRPRKLQARAGALCGHGRGGSARQSDRIRARDRRRRRGGRGEARHPSRRPGLPDLRPAARDVDGRGRAQAVRGRAGASLRADVLRRLVRLESGQRSRRHGARIRAADPFRPPAQRQARGGRLVLRGRSPRRRYRPGARSPPR